MLRLMCVICICLMTFPTFCESASKYQVATITDVKTHQAGGGVEVPIVSRKPATNAKQSK